jgi:hypothetical protein
MSALTPAGRSLIQLMSAAPRGPKREGLFALWLTVRVIEDLALDPPPAERIHRRRVAALERRLSSLVLPAPLRRGLTGTLHSLRDADRTAVASLLAQLAAPARDAVGPEAGDALAKAARARR